MKIEGDPLNTQHAGGGLHSRKTEEEEIVNTRVMTHYTMRHDSIHQGIRHGTHNPHNYYRYCSNLLLLQQLLLLSMRHNSSHRGIRHGTHNHQNAPPPPHARLYADSCHVTPHTPCPHPPHVQASCSASRERDVCFGALTKHVMHTRNHRYKRLARASRMVKRWERVTRAERFGGLGGWEG